MLSFPQWFKEFTTIVSNLAIAVAAIIGILGLWKWRAELVGKSKFKVARKMTMLALRFRDEYGLARSPWTDSREWAERKRSDDELRNESQVLDEYFARSRRLIPLQNTLRKLYEIGWEAEVVLSDQDAKLVMLFEKLFTDLLLTMGMFFDAQLNQVKNSSLGISVDSKDYEEMKDWRKVIYGIRGDEVSKLADNAADTVKKQLKKYIR